MVTLGWLLLSALLALTVGMLAWWRGLLTPSGVVGALLTGTALLGMGGLTGGAALMTFFVSSSLLSRLFRRQKRAIEQAYAKGATRDLGQALANGSIAAAAAIGWGLTGNSRWMGALLGALAAANADTWATELGVLSPSPPRMITSMRIAPAGASGAISLAGSLAALAGAATIAAVGIATAGIAHPAALPAVWHLTLAGLGGAFADSLLGATLQGVYWCPTCAQETERRVHRCGHQTEARRGLPWLGNDLVNLLATAAGGLVGYLW